MAGHDLQILGILAQQLGGPQGHIAVGGAVEAVAAQLVVLIVLVGDAVQIGMLRHGLVESGVEHSHLRHVVAQHLAAGLDADDIGRVVQGSQRRAVLHGLQHLIVDEHGGGEGLAAVDHTVTHRIDLLHGGDDAVLGIHQSVQHGLDGLGVGGHGHIGGLDGLLALHLGLVSEFAVQTDALAQALGKDLAGFRIHELILQGRAPRIDDKYFHDEILLIFLFPTPYHGEYIVIMIAYRPSLYKRYFLHKSLSAAASRRKKLQKNPIIPLTKGVKHGNISKLTILRRTHAGVAQWPGHQPSKLGMRVRFPSPAPLTLFAPVAQLDRATAF